MYSLVDDGAATSMSSWMDPALDIAPGSRFLGPAGRIWTVRSIAQGSTRIVVVRSATGGDCGMVIDHAALLRMVSIDDVESSVEFEEHIGAQEASATLAARPRRLSAREADVLALMAVGRSDAAIADRLAISQGAVEEYVANIFTKLQLSMSSSDNRRVLAVLHYLHTSPRPG